MVVRGACGAAEETAGGAEGNAAQLAGRQTRENRLCPKLQFHLTQKGILGVIFAHSKLLLDCNSNLKCVLKCMIMLFSTALNILYF